MPGQTPVYNFPYPCPDETVSPLDFQLLANAIDAKLVEVNQDAVLAANRFNVDLATSPIQVIPVNVDTTLTSPLATYTIPVAGVYIAHAFVNDDGTAGAMTMWRARIRQNGVVRYGHGQASPGNSNRPAIPVGPIVAAAGDVITVSAFFNGVGTVGVTCALDVKMNVRIA